MSRKFGERSLKSLRGVHPDLQLVTAKALLSSPVDFRVIEGLRTVERQRELVRLGASKTMYSRHIQGCAVDLWPYSDGGLMLSGNSAREKLLWAALYKIAAAMKEAAASMSVPLRWGGDWLSFKDGPHFELSKELYPNGVKYHSLDPETLVKEVSK